MLVTAEKAVYDRLKDMEQARTHWESRWQDVVDYLAPSRTDITTSRQPGAQKTEKIYDTTPTDALNKCAAGFMGYHTSQAAPWFSLSTANRNLMDFWEVKNYLQETVRALNLAFHRSNFYTMMHEFYIDLAGFGTACMYVAEDPENLLFFKTLPIRQVFIAENRRGLVDVVYRQYPETARNLEEQFGREALPDEIKKALADSNFDEQFECVHAVWPKTDIDMGGIPAMFPYQSAYFTKGELATGGEHVISKRGYFEFPYAVTRWSKDSAERMGRGPGIDNMPDIKTLQKQEKSILKAGQKAVDPPLDIPPGMRSAIRTGPAGLNFRAQGTEAIKPMHEFGQNIPIGTDLAEQRRDRIKKSFYNDVFMLLQNLQKGRMTIPELIERIQEKLIILGPVLGRLNHEATGPIIERSYAILARRFPPMLPPPPPVLLESDIEIEYISPLAKAQRAAELRSTADAVNMITGLTDVMPEIIDNINPDEYAREIWNLSGASQKLLNSEREVRAIREMRAQIQQLQEQKEQLMLGMKGAETVAKVGQTIQ